MCSILCISTQGASVSNAFNVIYVKAVDTFSTQYIHTCNGMHVNAVELQSRFLYKVFKLHENSIKSFELL